MAELLKVNDISMVFGGLRAVSNLTMHIDKGAGRNNFTNGSTMNPNAILTHYLFNFFIVYFA